MAKANDRLRDALLRNGLNLEHVSNATGVDQKTVERWITTGRTPYPRHRHTIASMVRETENYLWPDAVAPERKSEIAESEVVRVYPHRNSVPAELWDRLLSDAAEHIDILVLAGLFLVERPTFAKEITRKAADGAKIRLLFGDPAGREVAKRSEEEQLGKGTVAARIRNALAFVRPLSAVADVQIRFHKTTLYNSVFRFDDEMVVNTHVIAYDDGEVRQEFSLCFRATPTGGQLRTSSESSEVEWVTRERLDELNIHSSIRLRIGHGFDGRQEPYFT